MADDSVEVKAVTEGEVSSAMEAPLLPISVLVPCGNGKFREILKDPVSGKLVKKPRRMVTTAEFTQIGRKFLDMRVPDGKLSGKSKKRIELLIERMFDIAMSPLALEDAKYAMASVQAYKENMLRICGKPTISDEEKDALTRAGVKIVVIPAPVLMNPEVKEDVVHERPSKPSFIDAEFVTDEVKQTQGN